MFLGSESSEFVCKLFSRPFGRLDFVASGFSIELLKLEQYCGGAMGRRSEFSFSPEFSYDVDVQERVED